MAGPTVVTRLIEALERLLGMRSNPANDQLIISALDLVHGLLLLHPASRSLFAREIYMNVGTPVLSRQRRRMLTMHVALASARPARTHQPARHPPLHNLSPHRRAAGTTTQQPRV